MPPAALLGSVALKFVAIINLGLLPKARAGNKLVVLPADRHCKVPSLMPKATTPPQPASSFMVNLVAPYGIPSFLLKDDVLQSVSKFSSLKFLY